MASAVSVSASTFAGQRLSLRSKQTRQVRPARTPAVAKYGSDGVYFDLKDLSQTTGKWDLYGNDQKERYPGIQNKYFETAAGPLSRRGTMLFVLTSLAIGFPITYGLKGAKDANLAIVNGPKLPPVPGPRGRI
eukprot:jgi/Chlat1/357/Chrsp10S01477